MLTAPWIAKVVVELLNKMKFLYIALFVVLARCSFATPFEVNEQNFDSYVSSSDEVFEAELVREDVRLYKSGSLVNFESEDELEKLRRLVLSAANGGLKNLKKEEREKLEADHAKVAKHGIIFYSIQLKVISVIKGKRVKGEEITISFLDEAFTLCPKALRLGDYRKKQIYFYSEHGADLRPYTATVNSFYSYKKPEE